MTREAAPQTTSTSVDVVILTWNDADLAERAVASVLMSYGVLPSIVVVDNGSKIPFAVADQRVAVIRNAVNRGVAAGRNQGARSGAGEFVCFLDSDAVVGPDSLSRLISAIRSDDRIALAAPVFDGQPAEASAGRAPSLLRKVARANGRTATYESVAAPDSAFWDVDFAIGALQVVRRCAFEEVDGLDERYFYGPEDVDFCLRLVQCGYRIVQVRDGACIHPPRRSHRSVFTRRGLRHAVAVGQHLWRHRGFRKRFPIEERNPQSP